MNDQETKLHEGWKDLSEKEKDEIISFVRFLLEKHRPDFQGKMDIEIEKARCQLEEVRSTRGRLEKAFWAVREALYATLPGKDYKKLLVCLELLSFYKLTAEYKPFFFYDQNGAAFIQSKMIISNAKRIVSRVERMQT